MQNVIEFKKNTASKRRLSLKEAAEFLGMSYSQLRKIVVDENLIPYRNDGLGKYAKPSILISDLEQYEKDNTVQKKGA